MAHESATTTRSARWEDDNAADAWTAALQQPLAQSDPAPGWGLEEASAAAHAHSAIDIEQVAIDSAAHDTPACHHAGQSMQHTSQLLAHGGAWHDGAAAAARRRSSSTAGAAASAHGASGGRWWWQAVGSLAALYASVLVAPLFVFPAVFAHAPPSRDDLVGCLSLIVWSLVAIGGLKYTTIVFAEDADGEGGLFALLTLIRRDMVRYERDHPHLQQAKKEYESEHAAEGEDPLAAAASRPRLDTRSWSRLQRMGAFLFVRLHLLVLLLTFIGIVMSACASYLGPAVSVLSVVEALVAVQPSVEPQLVMLVMVTIKLILVSLHVRMEKIRRLFAPLMLVWVVTIAIIGVVNIAQEPSVLEALSPHHAALFLTRRGDRFWPHLGGVLLCVAGLLTAHANLGRVGARTARTAWWLLVFPSLVLAYAGQAARLMGDPSGVRHAFFATLPRGLYYPMLLLALLAAMVAANALFMGVFELVSAGGKLGILPRLAITHKDGPGGPLLLPHVAALLAFGAMTTVQVFANSLQIANAYSTAASVVFLVVSLLWGMALFFHRRVSAWLVGALGCICLFVDGGFLAANIYSLESCAYFPLVFTHVMWQALSIYQWGTAQRRRFARRGDPKSSALAQADSLALLLPGSAGDHSPDAQRQEELAFLRVLAAVSPSAAAATAEISPLDLSACSRSPHPLLPEPPVESPQISAMSSIGVFLASDNECVPRAAWQMLERQRAFPARAVFLRFECTQNPREDADSHVQVKAIYTSQIGRDAAEPAAAAATSAQRHLDRFELYSAVVRSGFTEHRVCMATVMRRLCDHIDFLERAGAARQFDQAAANATRAPAHFTQSSLAAAEADVSQSPSPSPESIAVPMSDLYEQLVQAEDLNPFEVAIASPSEQSPSGAAVAEHPNADGRDSHEHLPLTYYVRSETLLAPAEGDKPAAPTQSSRDSAAVLPTASSGATGPGVSGPGSRVSGAHSYHRAQVALRGIFSQVYNKVHWLDSAVAHYQIPNERVVEMSAQISLE